MWELKLTPDEFNLNYISFYLAKYQKKSSERVDLKTDRFKTDLTYVWLGLAKKQTAKILLIRRYMYSEMNLSLWYHQHCCFQDSAKQRENRDFW